MIAVAKQTDADEIATVMRRSILGCIADHQQDEKVIEQWLANKTASNVKDWIAQNFGLVFRQEDNANIVGFILVSAKGEILLNYVAPNNQGRGVGKKLLEGVKNHYRQQGAKTLFAESTLTAKPFYLSQGFEIIEKVLDNDKLVAYQMRLAL